MWRPARTCRRVPGDLQALRTFPTLGRILQRQHIANSSYNSLQVKAERSLSTRFSLLASFVWSKSIDDAGSILQGLYDSVAAQDERNLRLERGPSFSNPGRRISAGYVYRLRRWTLSGTVTLQDGTPENPFFFVLDFANSGTPNRPDIVPGQSPVLPRSQRTADHFINTAAFTAPAPYTFGNAGRNTIMGPGNNVFDLALQREFRVREGHTIRVRAESFNVFNHPNWGIVGQQSRFRSVLRQDFYIRRPSTNAVCPAVRFLDVARTLMSGASRLFSMFGRRARAMPPGVDTSVDAAGMSARAAELPFSVLAALHLDHPRLDALADLDEREWRDVLSYCDRSRLTLWLRDAAGDAMPQWVLERTAPGLGQQPAPPRRNCSPLSRSGGLAGCGRHRLPRPERNHPPGALRRQRLQSCAIRCRPLAAPAGRLYRARSACRAGIPSPRGHGRIPDRPPAGAHPQDGLAIPRRLLRPGHSAACGAALPLLERRAGAAARAGHGVVLEPSHSPSDGGNRNHDAAPRGRARLCVAASAEARAAGQRQRLSWI